MNIKININIEIIKINGINLIIKEMKQKNKKVFNK